MRDFKKVMVWQKAHALTLLVYKVSIAFPKDELYGLTGQIRRASSSIAANIAEGCGRDSPAELARFVQIASGSASELEYHVLLAHDLKFIDDATYNELNANINEIKKMLVGFIKAIKS